MPSLICRYWPARAIPSRPLAILVSLVACARPEGRSAAASARIQLTEPQALPLSIETPAPTLTWLTDHTLAGIDAGRQQVVVIDVNDGSTRFVGRKGSGPGEFMGASFIASDDSGAFAVADVQRSTVSLFDRDGRYVSASFLPGQPIAIAGLAHGVAQVAIIAVGTEPAPALSEVLLGARLASPSRALYALDSALRVPDRTTGISMPFVVVAGAGHGAVVVGNPRRYRIVEFGPSGERGRILQRPEMPEEPLSEDEIAERKAILRQVGAVVGPAGSSQLLNDLEQALAREKRPFFRLGGVSVGADGRVWVVTTRRTAADTTEVDVFRQDGTFQGTVSLRGAVLALAIRGDRMAAEIQHHAGDNDAAAAIDLYRIAPDSAMAEK